MARGHCFHGLRRPDRGALVIGSRPASSFRARIVQQLTFIAVLALVGFLWLALPAHAQTFKVGSFTKNTTTSGCPGSCTNTVAHGLGETPKALILWIEGKTPESFGASSFFGFGITDGTTSPSASAASRDACGVSDDWRGLRKSQGRCNGPGCEEDTDSLRRSNNQTKVLSNED